MTSGFELSPDDYVILASEDADRISWLRSSGLLACIDDKQGGAVVVNTRPTRAQVEGAVVIGKIPMWLQPAAKVIGQVDLTERTRGAHLSADEMDSARPVIRWYRVECVGELG